MLVIQAITGTTIQKKNPQIGKNRKKIWSKKKGGIRSTLCL